jgi:serine/threonine protein kinase
VSINQTKTIGGFTIVRALGAGGMAQIFEAYDPRARRRVALKMLAGHATDQEDLLRFRREADVLRGLSHPNIITIYEIGADGGHPFIAMELFEGGSVEDLLRKQGSLPMRDAIQLMIPVLSALDHAHAHEIVHRDIKPANVLLRVDGTPVAADFDLARPARTDPRARITAEGDRLGTPAYMAPEQLRGDELEARTDVYACGAMLFELITGHLPFDGDIAQVIFGHLQRDPPLMRTYIPSIPADLELLVGRMLAKDSTDRPTAALTIGALEDILAGRPATLLQARPASSPPPARRSGSGVRAMLRANAVIILLAVVVAGGLWAIMTRVTSVTSAPPNRTAVVSTTISTTVRPSVEIEVSATLPPARTALPSPTADVTIDAPHGSALWIGSPVMANAVEVSDSSGEGYRVGSLGVTSVLTTEVVLAFAEIEARAPEPVARSAIVRITLYDQAGAQIGVGQGFSITPLGEQQPTSAVLMAILLPEGVMVEQVARSEIVIDLSPPSEGMRAVGLEIIGEPSVRLLSGAVPAYNVQGVARNPTAATVSDAKVVLLLYDERGRVIGIEDQALEGDSTAGSISAGERAPFDIRAFSLGPEVAGYRVYVVGLQQ